VPARFACGGQPRSPRAADSGTPWTQREGAPDITAFIISLVPHKFAGYGHRHTNGHRFKDALHGHFIIVFNFRHAVPDHT